MPDEPRERTDVFKLTQDDWYPAYRLAGYYKGRKNVKLVTVSFSELTTGEWRVMVWGADDDGLEIDFQPSQGGAAVELFDDVIRQEYVNKEWLKDQGFIRA